MEEPKEKLIIDALADYPRAIGADIWRLQDERKSTLEALEEIPQAALEWQLAGFQNTIGTLLYHIALVEIDWLYVEVLEREYTPELESLFPYPVRDENDNLYPITNVSLADHLARLGKIRQILLDEFKTITLEDYYTERKLEYYDVTPEWVVHHLCQHEGEHRAEIQMLRTLYEVSVKSE